MARRILSISTDRPLLVTRHLLLKHAGYEVVSAVGLRAGVIHSMAGRFDLVVIGHSIAKSDKQALLREIRNVCSTPVLSLYRSNEGPIRGVDYALDAGEGPEQLLA